MIICNRGSCYTLADDFFLNLHYFCSNYPKKIIFVFVILYSPWDIRPPKSGSRPVTQTASTEVAHHLYYLSFKIFLVFKLNHYSELFFLFFNISL